MGPLAHGYFSNNCNKFVLLVLNLFLSTINEILSLIVIASQAIITGCFSLLSQSGSLGFCAPLSVYHTSQKIIGQIYVPTINWTLMILTLFVTIYFQSSSRLTNAYGLTVCSVSVITTILFLMIIKIIWKKSMFYVGLFGLFLVIDLLFWSANAMKFIDGAWIAILIALIFFVIAYSWFYGENKLKIYMRIQSTTDQLNNLQKRFGLTDQRQQSILFVRNQLFDIENQFEIEEDLIDEQQQSSTKTHFHLINQLPIESISNSIENSLILTPGIACFLTRQSRNTPHIFENYIRLTHSLPQLILFLRIQYARIPFVEKDKRLFIKLYGNIYHITATFGYAQTKNQSIFNDILLLAKQLYHLPIPENESQITFYLPNQIIKISRKGYQSYLKRWPLYLYSFQKKLIHNQYVNININSKNIIYIGIIAEL